ncbi:hypothetical protein GQ43DRAFT_365626 [Delitschia confertaspora ATCC 74209]|uniref:Uncharacterized protein n=1 Tax=Delitschia confertaspora ATCC 74209 TaxID=1513339 RepID=A0A9P4MY69_9PLEO|nr:hypothetical protein GQ43DRAFT_365626 [Delitschia confertaspora ATCC 74209]
MCDYTQVHYKCSHLRYTVRAWCTKYQETHKRCLPNVVAIEYRLDENCGLPPRYPLSVYKSPLTSIGDCKGASKSGRPGCK